MKFAAGSDKGLIREINEDSYNMIEGCTESLYAFIIADGMGGHNSGEIASSSAVEYISDSIVHNGSTFLPEESCEVKLRELVENTNSAVYQKSQERPELNGMGTTLTMAVIVNTIMTAAHVGDSRLYQIRDGKLLQLTKDHSYIEELVRKGTLTREEAENHPRKNVITRAIGCSPELDVDIISLKMNKDDIFIFCTDGLTNMLGEDEILETAANNDPDAACAQLIEAAKKHGGEDNITVIVIKCE